MREEWPCARSAYERTASSCMLRPMEVSEACIRTITSNKTLSNIRGFCLAL